MEVPFFLQPSEYFNKEKKVLFLTDTVSCEREWMNERE